MNGYDAGVVELLDLSRFHLEPDPPEFEEFLLPDEREMSELAAALELHERDVAEASAFESEQVRATGALLHVAAAELGMGSESLAHPGLAEALDAVADADDSTREAWGELPVEAWGPRPEPMPAPDDVFLPRAPDDTEPIHERPPMADLPPLALWGDFTNQAVLLGDWLVQADLPVAEFPVGGTSAVDPEILAAMEQLARPLLTQAQRRIWGARLAEAVGARGATVVDPQFWYNPNTRTFRPGP